MLYLLDSSDGAERWLLAERTADLLESALLAADLESCRQTLVAALESDLAFAAWVDELAERQGLATVDLAAWLSDCLASKLAPALVSNSTGDRLPALVAKLSAFEARLSSYDSRLEREKLEALKELAYGAGHEINNPLANIAARAQTLLEDEPQPERQRKLTAIHRQAMRAHEMIADLMLFARPPKLNIAELNLDGLVQQVVDELRELAAERSIKLSCAVGESPIIVHGDETQLGVAISAVVKNAIEAVGASGHIDLTARQLTVDGRIWAEVVVRDDGPGVSAEVRRHLFDPFFSGREAGRGLGFGLSKCWRIVSEHGGQVVVSSIGGHGAEFTISLPTR